MDALIRDPFPILCTYCLTSQQVTTSDLGFKHFFFSFRKTMEVGGGNIKRGLAALRGIRTGAREINYEVH